ncbi:MAG TPA: hypothetical protein VIO32_08085, partial [Candidatus Baltobacteraceae bacterium]
IAAPPLPTAFSFTFLGSALRVATADPNALRLLETAFQPVRCAAAPPGMHPISVRIPLSDDFAAAFYTVRDVFGSFCAQIAHRFAIYGGCAAAENQAFGLLGDSTVGKTTLLLHLHRLGARFLGDESFLLAQDGTLNAFPRLPALREPALPLLDPALREAIRSCPHYERFPAGRLWFALPAAHLLNVRPDGEPKRLAAVFVVERAQTTHVEALSPRDTLHAVVQRAYRKPKTLESLARMRRALADVRGYRLHLAEPQAGARTVLETLKCA